MTGSNEAGNDSAQIQLTVMPLVVADAAPSLDNIETDLIFVVGVGIAPVIFDNDGGDVEEDGCRASTSLPPGLRIESVLLRTSSINSRTCQLAGTPTEITPTTGEELAPIAIISVIGTNAIGSDPSPALVRLTVAPQQPSVSVGTIVDGNTVVTVTNSSMIDGTAYILVLPSSAPPPSPADIRAGATQSAMVSAGASFPVSVTGLTDLEGQTAYVIVESAGVSSAVLTVSLSEPSPPIITLGVEITATTTTVSVSSDQDGTAHVLVLPRSSPTPMTPALLKANPATLSMAVTTEAPASFDITGLNNSVSYKAIAVVTAEGGDSIIATKVFTIDTSIPNFAQSVYTISVSVGQNIDENFDNISTDSARISTCTADVPLGLNVIAQASPGNGCTLVGVLEEEPTITSFTVIATNGISSATFDLNLIILAPLPILEDALAQTYYVGQADAVIDFASTGGPPESCSIDASRHPALPAGLTLALTTDGSSCQITGTPNQIAPATLYTITATNSGGSATATVDITVRAPTPPSLSAPESGLNQFVGRALDPVVVVGNSNSALGAAIVADSCALVDGTDPALAQVLTTVNGLQVSTGSQAVVGASEGTVTNVCEISGTPAMVDESTLNIRATSVEGGMAIFTLTFVLRDIPPAIALTGAATRAFTVGLDIEPINFSNSGGVITSCAAEPSLLASLVIDPITCAISGAVDAPIDPAIEYTITATSGTGMSAAMVTIGADNPDPPMLAATGGIVDFSYTRSLAITDIILNNAQAGSELVSCAVEPGSNPLPSGLSLMARANTCAIFGTPDEAVTQAAHAITATDAAGGTSTALSVNITVLPLAPMLQSLEAVSLTARAQTGLPIIFSNMGDEPAGDGCTVEPALPAGLRIGLSDDGTACQITGTPEDVDSPQTATVTVSATNANPAGATGAEVAITVNPAAPVLPEANINAVAVINTAIETLVIPGTGGVVATCYFVVEDASKPTTTGGLTVATADAGCQLTGMLSDAGAVAFVVGADNASGTAMVQVDFTVLIGAQPVLAQPAPDSLDQTVGVSLAAAPITLENINNGFPLDADSCIFVDSAVEATATALASQTIDGLTISTVATAPGTCQVSGTPSSVGTKTLRVRATSTDGTTSAVQNSNIVEFAVAVINPPPNISASRSTLLEVATVAIVAVDFSSDAGPVQSCSVIPALPAGLSLNTSNCQITGTPAAVDRPRQTIVTVTATNDGGDSAVDITITINPQLPALTSRATLTAAQTYYAGEEGRTIVVTGTGGTIDSCAFTTTPPLGLSVERFNSNRSCRIFGTPVNVSANALYTISATNVSGSATAMVAIQVRAPRAPMLTAPTSGLNPIAMQAISPALEVTNTATEAGTAIATAGCALVNSANLNTARAITVINGLGVQTRGNACTVSGTPVTPGAMSVHILATSVEGGRAIVSLSFNVRAPLPAIALDGTATRVYIAEQTITPITFVSRGGPITSCRTQPALPSGLTINTTTCAISGSPGVVVNPAGVYRVIATNATGDAPAVSVSIRVNPIPLPAFAAPAALNLVVDVRVNRAFANTEVGGGRVSRCIGTVPRGLTIAPAVAPANGCVLSGAPDTVANATNFPVVATNDFGSTTLTLNIAVVAIPPAITSVGAQIYPINQPITPVIFANTGGTIQPNGCTIDTGAGHPALPAGLSLETTTVSGARICRITGTPNAETAQTIYTVTASSLGGSDTATVAITVQPAPEPFLISLVDVVLIAAGGGDIEPIIFDNTGSNATACTGSASAGARSPVSIGLVVDVVTHPVSGKRTCRISGTAPEEGVNNQLYGVSATNDAGSHMATVTIRVTSAPIISVQSRRDDNLFRYGIGVADTGRRISFTSSGSAISTCTVANANLPAGMSIDSSDCTITGVPTRTDEVTTTHTVTATSIDSSTETIMIETYRAHAPQILPFSPRAVNLPPGTSGGLPLVFKNIGGNVSSCMVVSDNTAAATPLGTTFDLSFMPTADGRSCQLARANAVTETANTAVTYNLVAANSVGTSYFSITLMAQAPPATLTLTPDRGNTYEFSNLFQIEPITFTTSAPGLCSIAPTTTNGPVLPSTLSIDPVSCSISGFVGSGAVSLQEGFAIPTPTPLSYTVTHVVGDASATAVISIAINGVSPPSFGRYIPRGTNPAPGVYTGGFVLRKNPRNYSFNLVQNSNYGLPRRIEVDGRDIDECFVNADRLAQYGLYIYSEPRACVIDSIDGNGPPASADGLDYTIAVDIAARDGLGGEGPPYSRFFLVIRAQRQIQLGGGADANHTCYTNASGQLFCFGSSDNGELGIGLTDIVSARPSEVQVVDRDWTDISTASDHTCAVGSGELYCWGNSDDGQLGLNDLVRRPTPTRVGGATDWSAVSAGTSHTCAIRSGELYCWGNTADGQLGLNNPVNRPTPTRVGGATDWSAVSAGNLHTCGIRGSGQLHCWGNGDDGRLGLGNTTATNTPTRVGGATDWSAVSAGVNHTCGLRSSGQLHCWGNGDDGRLGLGNTTATNTPTRVGNATGWSAVSTGASHTCAIRSGQLHCWGNGDDGRLGLGNVSSMDAPAQVGSGQAYATGWHSVTAAASHTCAARTEASVDQLYCWGNGSDGRLSLSTATGPMVPTMVDLPISNGQANINPDTLPPEISPSNTRELTFHLGADNLSINFNNRGGVILDCTISPALPAGLVLSKTSCQISGEPTGSASPLRAHTVTAYSPAGVSDASVNIGVAAPLAPMLHDYTGPSRDGPAQLITTETIPPIIFGNSGDGITSCRASSNLPAGLAVSVITYRQGYFRTNSCQITGVPTLAVSPAVTVTVTGTNFSGSSTATVQIAVSNVPPPDLNDIDRIFLFQSGVPITPIVFSNTGRNASTCAGASSNSYSNPSTLGLDAELIEVDGRSTCRITGTPADNAVARTSYGVRASNVSGSDTATVSIRVYTISPPIFANPKAVVVARDQLVNQTFFNTATTGGRVVSCTGTVPQGLSISPAPMPANGCVLTGAPTATSAARVYAITATNDDDIVSELLNLNIAVVASSSLSSLSAQTILLNVQTILLYTYITPVELRFTGSALSGCYIDTASGHPALPDDLTVSRDASGQSCRITGGVRQPSPATVYTITATHAGGSSTGAVSITISAIVPVLLDIPEVVVVQAGSEVNIVFTNIGGDPAVCLGANERGSFTRRVQSLLFTQLNLVVQTHIDEATGRTTCAITGRVIAQSTPATLHSIGAINEDGYSPFATVTIQVQ